MATWFLSLQFSTQVILSAPEGSPLFLSRTPLTPPAIIPKYPCEKEFYSHNKPEVGENKMMMKKRTKDILDVYFVSLWKFLLRVEGYILISVSSLLSL
jgi:hypothetical protein